MNAPLSRYLVEFSHEKAPEPFELVEMEPHIESEPMVSMTVEAFDAAIDEARERAAAEAHSLCEATLTSRFDDERAELHREFETSREAWATEQGETIAASLGSAIKQLETELSTALAAALRPLFAEACRSRILAEVGVAVAALLGDPSHPPIRIEGPVDLLTAFGNTQAGDVAIDYVVSERAELTIITDSTRIETRLSACLSGLHTNEG